MSRVPGAPLAIGHDEVAVTIRKIQETLPKGCTHWTSRGHGERDRPCPSRLCSGSGAPSACNCIGSIRASCRQIPCLWRKVRDKVGLYLSLPERAVVLRVNQKAKC